MSFGCPDTPKPSLEKQCCWAEPWCKQWSICSPPRRGMTPTGCPVTAIMCQHVVLGLHICHAIDVKRLQGCELGFTVMNQPASASFWIDLSCVNERCFCLLPSENKLYPWFLYLFSCLNRHWEGRGVCMSFYFFSVQKGWNLIFWGRKTAKISLQCSCKWLHSSF